VSDLTAFHFDDLPLRVVERDGDPWFVLADVCRVLEIGNPSQAATRLDDDEKSTLTNNEGRAGHGAQAFTIINESGLWSLVLVSRKPQAKQFKKWITAEVIPSIRKTGGYGSADPMKALNDPVAMRGLLLTYTERVIEQQAQIDAMAPKVQALDRIATAEGSLCITDAAKALQMPPRKLFDWLQRHHWIYRRHGTSWLGYSSKTQAGLLEHKVTSVAGPDGYDRVREQVRVTPKGLAKLSEALAGERQGEMVA